MDNKIKKLAPIKRNNVGLKIALFDAINGIRTGAIPISEALAIHKLATQIIELTKMEINNVKIIPHTFEATLLAKKQD